MFMMIYSSTINCRENLWNLKDNSKILFDENKQNFNILVKMFNTVKNNSFALETLGNGNIY